MVSKCQRKVEQIPPTGQAVGFLCSEHYEERIKEVYNKVYSKMGWCLVCGEEAQPRKSLIPLVGLWIWRSCSCRLKFNE